MADDHGVEHHTEQIGGRTVELRVAAQPENLAMVRLLVGAVATFVDLNIDAVADLRLAVDELCSSLISCASPQAVLTVLIDPGDDELTVRASALCERGDVVAPDTFTWHVLTSLVDEVRLLDGRDRLPPATEMGGGAPNGEPFGVVLVLRQDDS